MSDEIQPDRAAKAREALAAKRALEKQQDEAKAAPAAAAELTDDEIRTKRDQLMTALADLPPVETAAADLPPGTVVGEGIAQDKVQFTREWYLDIETRRKDRTQTGELQWPDYRLHEVFETTEDIEVNVNGVKIAVLKGRMCKLPTPHYAAYMNAKQNADRIAAQFAKPDRPEDGMKAHVMGLGPLEPRPVDAQ